MKYHSGYVVNPIRMVKSYLSGILDVKTDRKLLILSIISSCSSSISTAAIHSRLLAAGESCGIRCVQKDLESLLYSDIGVSRHGVKGDWYWEDKKDSRYVLISEAMADLLVNSRLELYGHVPMTLRNELEEISAAVSKKSGLVEKNPAWNITAHEASRDQEKVAA